MVMLVLVALIVVVVVVVVMVFLCGGGKEGECIDFRILMNAYKKSLKTPPKHLNLYCIL